MKLLCSPLILLFACTTPEVQQAKVMPTFDLVPLPPIVVQVDWPTEPLQVQWYECPPTDTPDVLYNVVSIRPGDFDWDGDVDLIDWMWFQRCYNRSVSWIDYWQDEGDENGDAISHNGCDKFDCDGDEFIGPRDWGCFVYSRGW